MIKLENFSVSEFPVTKIEWDAVRLWAKERGYTDLAVGRGKGKQPVGCITWYDAVKFLNALSELAGLEPVYKTHGEVYKTGNVDLVEHDIDNFANGYRLPFEEEWVYAARGDNKAKYLWGDEEYPGCFDYAQEFKETQEITKEVGLKKPNSYGLYDVIGNVYEWCFDKKYNSLRVIMGGSVSLDSILETDFRSVTSPEYKCYETGVRVFSSNLNAESVDNVARKSEFYGKEEWPKAVYTDMSKKAIAERLKKLLSDDEFSIEIKNSINLGKFDEAFEFFRDKKFEEIRKQNRDIAVSAGFPNKIDKLLKKDDINDIVFFKGNFEYDVYHGFDEFVYLAEEFSKTGNKKYFDTCILILKAYLTRHKAEFDILTDEQLTERNNTPITWAWGNGFDTMRRQVYIINGLAELAVGMDGDYSDFPAELFAELAVSLVTYGMYPGIKDGREKVTNQIAHCANCILNVTGIFYEFKISGVYEEISLARYKKGMESSIYPDGSAAEQSIDYNYYTLANYFGIKKNIRKSENLNEIIEVLSPLNQMLLSVKTPVLSSPITAYTYTGIGFRPIRKEELSDYYETVDYIDEHDQKNIEWSEWDRIKNAVKKMDTDIPKFNSIFFPYGGTAAIRDGWDSNAQYMYFFAPRAGSGHSAEAVCDVQFQAFGRELIKTGGQQSYKLVQRMSKEQIPMMDALDEYVHSSKSRNTILVDGEGQSRMKDTEQVVSDKYSDTTGYRWHENERLVYVEGRYSDGYYGSSDVNHKREILFLKKERVWIVVDRLYSEKPHTYTQNWHFNVKGEVFERKLGEKLYRWDMDGFERKDIVIGTNGIYTKDKHGANVFLYHFDEMKYTRYYGEKEPYAGWSSRLTQGFRFFPVEEIHCDFRGGKNTVILTVIEASKNTQGKMSNIIRKDGGGSFEMHENIYSFIKKDNGRIELSKNDKKWIVLDDLGKEFYEIMNGNREEFKAPIDFGWKEENGYFFPVYEY